MKTTSKISILFIGFIVLKLVLFSQSINAQSYVNINFVDTSNKYALISDLKEISFSGTDITFTKNDNSSSSETISLIDNISFDATAGGGTPLPVELVSFTANTLDKNVFLSWQTATEVNNYGFFVQRKKDKDKNWIELGFIKGAGNSNSPKEYNYSDELSGINQVSKLEYRLKQTDTDGSFVYSNIVNVLLGAPDKYELTQNYPNPFNPTTMIKYGLSENGFVNLNVYNILGEEVASLVNKEMTAGYHEVSFGTNDLASGMYIYRISVGNKFAAIKKMLMVK